MGGGGQANTGQATGAYNSQQQAATQDAALSKQNAATQKQMVDMLFGNGTPGSTGAVSGMLDPAALNSGSPTGAYNTAWKQAQDQIAQNYKGQRGSLAQSWANSGMGANNTPSGFQADQERKLGSSEADTRGQTYTGIVGQQHSDALNNFWNGANIASGQAASSGGTAAQAAGNEGSSSSALYGTAGQYHPSAMGNIVGSAIGAGGTVGAAAMCAAEGAKILMADATRKPVEDLRKGDKVAGVDGKPDELVEDPYCSIQEICEVKTKNLRVRVSLTHAFVRHAGGYSFAAKSLGETLDTEQGPTIALEVRLIGEKVPCFSLFLKRSHGYNVEGFWSLE